MNWTVLARLNDLVYATGLLWWLWQTLKFGLWAGRRFKRG